jgi:hypothetical protein
MYLGFMEHKLFRGAAVIAQALVFATGAYLFIRPHDSSPVLQLALSLVLMGPIFLVTISHLWKDSIGLAIAMMMFGLWKSLQHASVGPPLLYLSMGLALFGASIRPSASIFFAGLCVFIIASFLKSKARGVERNWRFLISAAAGLSIIVGAVSINAVLTDVNKYPLQYQLEQDLMTLSQESLLGQPAKSPSLRETSFELNASIFSGPEINPLVTTGSKFESLLGEWWDVVKSDPMGYFTHRSRFFIEALGFLDFQPPFIGNGFSDASSLHPQSAFIPLTSFLISAIRIGLAPVFLPGVWLMVILTRFIAWPAGRPHRHSLAFLSIALLLPLFFLVPAGDFRYFAMLPLIALAMITPWPHEPSK